MPLSFTPSRPALALFGATMWRVAAVIAMLLLPIAIFYYALRPAYVLAFTALLSVGLPWGAFAIYIIAQLLPIICNNFVFPVIAYACVVRWMSRKRQLGTYTYRATYNGDEVTTFRKAFGFALYTYLEFFKYLWPIFIVGGMLGYAFVSERYSYSAIDTIFGLTAVLSIYLHLLVLTDLLHRGTYSKNRCTLSFTQMLKETDSAQS